MRKWLARKFYLWANRLDESEWHDITLTRGDAEISFSCYGDWVGRWNRDWDMSCSCEERDGS